MAALVIGLSTGGAHASAWRAAFARGAALALAAGLAAGCTTAPPATGPSGVPSGLAASAARPLKVVAAGSLRAPLTEITRAFEAAGGARTALEFAPSGLLRDRLLAGEAADVFASANTEHPQALAAAGRAEPPAVFARNAMCALASPALAVTPASLLEAMLDPRVRLGTSTPRSDPAGDYAWAVFRRAEALRPGSFERLSAKALTLTGAPDSRAAPAGRSVYAMHVAEGRADLFLTYCTNATAAVAEQPALRVVELPPELAVGADYGVAVLAGAAPAARGFVGFLRGPDGQAILRRHGFR